MSPADAAATSPDAFREFRGEDVEQSIAERFERVVAARPDAPAVCTRELTLSYEALNRAANRLARSIHARLGGDEEAVAILLDQGVDAVIAILAALKAGKLYLPLEPTHPPSRLAAMLDDADARLVVTDAAHAAQAAMLAGADRAVLRVDDAPAARVDDNLRLPLAPGRLAYLFYTSGSTGLPKGVVDSHRNVLHNVMRYTNHLRITASDRLSLIQSPSFSGTVSSLFGALLNGGAIYPFNLREQGFAPLAAWLADLRITIYHSVPLIFRAVATEAPRFPAVRVVRLEGDQALPSDAALFRARFPPGCLLAIGLGATETGLSCQYRIDAQTPIGEGVLPVGYPTQDMAIVILDDAGRDVGRGRTGEIGVRSRYLAVGYWRQPERTRAAFLPDPMDPDSRIYRSGDLGRLRADGCLEFLGRRDFRPRIRGQDVDIAEVEAALTRIGSIREAAVVAREDVPGEPRLVACVVVADGRVPTLGAVRSALAATLPAVAMPSSLVAVDRLPLDDNGKLDRRALSASIVNAKPPRIDRTTPRDALERQLIAVWEEVFQRRGLAVTDDFFELGGDSLLAARIVVAVERVTRVRLSPNVLYAAPDVARLAACIRGSAGSGDSAGPNGARVPRGGDHGDPVLVPLQPEGTQPPVFLVHDHAGSLVGYADLVRRLGADQPCYGLRSPCELPHEPAPRTLEELATRHRAAIERVQPAGPYRLSGVCFGGVVAYEIARQLVARGESVALLAIVAVTPYDFPALVTERARTLFALHAARARLVPRLRYYVARLRGLGPEEVLRYLRGRSRQVLPWLEGRRRALVHRREPASQCAPPSALGALHDRLFRAYVARPLDGRATLFLSASSVEQYSSDPARDWRPLATEGVDVRLMDVAGGAMLDEPHVEALADAIAASVIAAGQPQPAFQRVSIAITTSRSASRRARRRSRSCGGSARSISAK